MSAESLQIDQEDGEGIPARIIRDMLPPKILGDDVGSRFKLGSNMTLPSAIENVDSAAALEPLSAIIGEENALAQKPILQDVGGGKEVEVYEEEKSVRRFWLRVIVALILLAAIIGGIAGGLAGNEKEEYVAGNACLPGHFED